MQNFLKNLLFIASYLIISMTKPLYTISYLNSLPINARINYDYIKNLFLNLFYKRITDYLEQKASINFLS